MPAPVDRARRLAGRVLRRTGLRYDPASERPVVPGGPHGMSAGPLAAGLFVNPIGEGADPCVVRDGSRYLWAQSEGNAAVALWTSDRLTSLGEKHVVWRAAAEGACSRSVWAPELIELDGRWHIYFTASDGVHAHHLAYVLRADTDDPLGAYTLHGPLNTGDGPGRTSDNAWAIDMTVLEHGGRQYALWSGWPDAATQVQHLYIAPMASPVSVAGPRVQLCTPLDYPWERVSDEPGAEGINEAPQVLIHGGRTFVVYSCGSALLPSYKLGLIELLGDDPLDVKSWRKHPEPIFTSTADTFGVGHGNFLRSPDGSQWWHVYHAKIARRRNFRRVIQVQPMSWSADGMPELGEPVAAGIPLPEPAGTPHRRHGGPHRWRFGHSDGLADFDYYGHHQFFSVQPDGLHLGEIPERPINDFRSGEKVVLRDGDYGDLRARATFRISAGARDVGLLFRVSGAAVGYNAQRGYFAAIVPRSSRLVLGATDGRRWSELAGCQVALDPSAEHTLVVHAVGTTLTAYLEDAPATRLVADSDAYPRGSVGLRVVDTSACFSSFAVEPVEPPPTG